MTSAESGSPRVGLEELRLYDGTRVLFRTNGRGGTPLLLLHGFMGDSREWVTVAETLPAEILWVALDLPGHGASPPLAEGAYRLPELVGLLDRVQRRLFGGEAWWLGYSMGGRIALAGAAEGVAMRGLLLESASPGLKSSSERADRRVVDEERARDLEDRGTEAFVGDWLGMPLFRGLEAVPEELRALAREIRTSQDAASMARWLREAGTGAQPSFWDALSGVEAPLHLMVGSEDAKFVQVAEQMREARPATSLTLADGAGHLPHLEAPEAWRRWVTERLLG